MSSRAVNLRIQDDIRALIDRAAKAHGTTRSDFMIDAARRAAEEALLDQVFVRAEAEAFDHYRKILDRPAQGKGFERLMKARKPWAG